jgi:hypothetical protein
MSGETPTSQLPDWWPYRPDPDYRAPARRAVSGVCELSHIFAGRCDGPRRARNWPRIMGYTNAAGRARMHAPGRPRRHHVDHAGNRYVCDSPRFEPDVSPRPAGGAGGARSDADVTIRPCARCTQQALAVKWHLPEGRSAPLTDEVDLFLLNNAARVARGLAAITLDDYRAECALRERRVRAAHVYRHAVMRERTAATCMQEAQRWAREVGLNTAMIDADLDGWQHSAESLGPAPARVRPEVPAAAYDPWAALADAGDTLDLGDVRDTAGAQERRAERDVGALAARAALEEAAVEMARVEERRTAAKREREAAQREREAEWLANEQANAKRSCRDLMHQV